MFLSFSGYIPGVELLDHVVALFFFLMHPHTVLHTCCTNLHFPSAVLEGSRFRTPSGAFVIFTDDGHSDLCEVIPRYGLDLHFSDN